MDLRDPKNSKIVLGVLLLVGLAYVYFGTRALPFSYKVYASEIGKLESEYENLSLEINRARQSAKNLPRLEAEYNVLQQKWSEARKLLPEAKQVADLLREISFRGQSCGVEFVLFKPLPPVAGELYNENPVEIRIEGGYHEIAAFLNEIASMKRIVNVRDLEITQLAQQEETGKTASAHFVAVAYTLSQGAVEGKGSSPAGTGPAGKVKQVLHRTVQAATGGGE